jgi:hypothetical protein
VNRQFRLKRHILRMGVRRLRQLCNHVMQQRVGWSRRTRGDACIHQRRLLEGIDQ